MEHLGQRLRLIRLSAGLTQQTLAERAQTSTNVISHIETGAPRPKRSRPYEPGLELMARIAGVFEKPIDAFLEPLTNDEIARLADLERLWKEGRRHQTAAAE